jgi:hypothetical protein
MKTQNSTKPKGSVEPESTKAYVKKSCDSANYANPLYIVHYPDGRTLSTMQKSKAYRERDLYNSIIPKSQGKPELPKNLTANWKRGLPINDPNRETAQRHKPELSETRRGEPQHSPLPWHLKPLGNELYVEHEHGFVCDMQLSDAELLETTEQVKQDAQYIVRACNAYPHAERLAEALNRTLDALFNQTHGEQDSPWISDTKALATEALAQWEEVQKS